MFCIFWNVERISLNENQLKYTDVDVLTKYPTAAPVTNRCTFNNSWQEVRRYHLAMC